MRARPALAARVAWDLVGIWFGGHEDLRGILLEVDWEGHPLRKYYQMPTQYGVVPMYGQPYSDNPFPQPEPAPDDTPDQPAGTDPAEG